MIARTASSLVPSCLFAAALLAGGSPPALAEAEPPPAPCSAPEFAQFDFWIGEWDVTWEGGGGTNRISKEYDGCVIREQFEGDGLRGTSLTTWSPGRARWLQTWVDNTGSYLEFEGGQEDDRMVLSREVPDGTDVTHQRMVFHEIAADSFTWDWEKSTDEGESWELLWRIHYRRQL